MRLPAEEIAGSGPGGLVRRANTNSVTAAGSQLSQITCQEYVLKPETAVFQGDVHVQHPEMNWQCETITAQLSSEAKNGRVVAEKNVVFDLTQDQVHGTGNRAVFTFGSAGGSTNSILELTGNPVLTTTNGIFQNQVIVMDLTKKRMVAPGRFRIQGNENAPPLDLRK
jgi:lipopolysaccharide export system protein LptA